MRNASFLAALLLLTACSAGASEVDWRVEIMAGGGPPGSESLSITIDSFRRLMVTKRWMAEGGPQQMDHNGELTAAEARKLRDLAEAAIKSLDLTRNRPDISDGAAFNIRMQVGRIGLEAHGSNLMGFEAAGEKLVAFVKALNRHLPDDFRVFLSNGTG